MTNPEVLLIGVGNEYCGDDGAGLAVVRALKTRKLPPAVRLLEAEMCDGASLLSLWRAQSQVILIDAVSSGAPAGTIYRFDALAQPLPANLCFRSTHGFGVADALALAYTLNQIPFALLVYAIEGQNFTAHIGLSPAVEKAVQVASEQICQMVSLWCTQDMPASLMDGE
jgi:hydrogenase maturation protease